MKLLSVFDMKYAKFLSQWLSQKKQQIGDLYNLAYQVIYSKSNREL